MASHDMTNELLLNASIAKDGFGARDVMAKGIEKVRLHIMFGVVSLLLKTTDY